MKNARLLFVLFLIVAAFAFAQTPAAAPPPPAPAAAPSPAAPAMITDQDIKGLSGPDAKARANGDPDGGLTGTVSDVAVADPVTDKTPQAKGLTIGDIANQAGQNKIAINFLNINKYLCHLLHSSKGPSRFRLAGGPSYPASHAAYRVRQVIAELVM